MMSIRSLTCPPCSLITKPSNLRKISLIVHCRKCYLVLVIHFCLRVKRTMSACQGPNKAVFSLLFRTLKYSTFYAYYQIVEIANNCRAMSLFSVPRTSNCWSKFRLLSLILLLDSYNAAVDTVTMYFLLLCSSFSSAPCASLIKNIGAVCFFPLTGTSTELC